MGFKTIAGIAAGLAMLLTAGAATANPFAEGWTLDEETSRLDFLSVKNTTVVENQSFATLSGTIDEDGNASVKVSLDSIDTGIDLRNVRMRFLFFETFQYPHATITATLEPTLIEGLAQRRRMTVDLPFLLDLHGIIKTYSAPVAVTLLSNDLVSVASTTPISIAAEDHNLATGVGKLEEAAGVELIPSGSVSFDLMFRRNVDAPAELILASSDAEAARSTALEAAVFDREACVGRFEIASRADTVNFASGSARLDQKGRAFLETLADVVQRCPGLAVEIAGHTDSDGSASANQRLSELRARSVMAYLTESGVAAQRLSAVGHGEAIPLVDNTTRENKARNRRIEFSVGD